MAVRIAVDISINNRLHLGTNIFPVQRVVATTADSNCLSIARKMIVLEFDTLTPMYLPCIAATNLALGIMYWLLQHGRLPPQ